MTTSLPIASRLALEAGPATLDLAVELGVTGVPIDGDALLGQGPEAVLAPLRARGLEPCQVGAFFCNPLHPDPRERAEGLDRVARLIPLAAAAGCPWVAFSGGSCCPDIFGGSDPRNLADAALEEAAAALAPLAALAARHGVTLSLEPHLRSLLSTPERAAALCARVGSPALRVTFDISNFYDFAALLEPAPLLARAARALAPCCGLVHLKEIALTPGFHLHAGLAPLGGGHTDWTEVLRHALPIAPAGGWVLVEHCQSPAEARASIALTRAAAAAAGRPLA